MTLSNLNPGASFMLEVRVRKKLILLEDIFHEGGPVSAVPQRRGAALAVIHNPFAGAYVENIAEFMEDLKPFGLSMAQSLVAALGGDPRVVEGYGKGAIVGTAGELEHGALWHVPGGYAMRELLGNAKAIVPSSKKVGAPGTRLDVPITHINASYVRGHFSAMEVGIVDAPRAEEMVLILVMTTGARGHAAAILHPRLGKPLRAAVEKGAALVPSAKKRGPMGAAIDVPLGHKDAAYVRSHFDAMEIRVADAPRASEIVVAVVVTDS